VYGKYERLQAKSSKVMKSDQCRSAWKKPPQSLDRMMVES
jgi:hypothetical protein